MTYYPGYLWGAAHLEQLDSNHNQPTPPPPPLPLAMLSVGTFSQAHPRVTCHHFFCFAVLLFAGALVLATAQPSITCQEDPTGEYNCTVER